MERNLSRILSLYVSVVLGASGAVYSRERLGASPFVLVFVSLAMYPGARRRWDHDLATSGRLAFEPVGDRVRALYNNNNNNNNVLFRRELLVKFSSFQTTDVTMLRC